MEARSRLVERVGHHAGLVRIVRPGSNDVQGVRIVAATDYVVTLPERVALAVAKQHRLVVVRPPLRVPTFSTDQFWHARSDEDAAHRWFRQQVKAAVT